MLGFAGAPYCTNYTSVLVGSFFYFHYQDYHYKQKHPAETRRPLIGLRFGAFFTPP